jgi:hypothetical protein
MSVRAKYTFIAISIVLAAFIGASAAPSHKGGKPKPVATTVAEKPVIYQTYGVHNPPADSPCTYPTCVYVRKPGEPTNPEYPIYWTSRWNMYRVFQNYADNPPSYDGKPPAPLKDGIDYQTSQGVTYYDSTWNGGQGAMMEHYEHFCLPIFPIANNFTCSFISLGDIAYFVTYEPDRPKGMPRVCLFSEVNHPPRRDFIMHLPYSKGDSDRIGAGKLQGYSFWIDGNTGKPVQVGAKPDRTADGDILFGYAFWATPGFDPVRKTIAPYRQPQSFYFSGYPLAPANAPIVSQNYTDFAMVQPDPVQTWDQVAGLDPATLPRCQLFDPPPSDNGGLQATQAKAHTWGDIGRPLK